MTPYPAQRPGKSLRDRSSSVLHAPGRDPARYALIEITPALIDQQAALKAAGFRRTLPWFSRAGYVEMYQQSLRAGAEASARQQGADDATVRAAGSSVVARHADRVTPFALEVNEASVVPHEIGHGWYVEAFWPGYSIEATGHYGRPGPDWLDEVAPILMESGDSAELRRSLFRDVYRAQGRGILADYPVADLIDLPRFLSRDHPTKAGSREKKNDATRTGAPVIKVVATDSEAQMASIREASLFYPQGRIFADFLLDRTGDPAVFGSIGDAFGRGETFEQWLAANGADKGLASTVPGLDRDWRQWLAGRFGAPGAG